MIAGAVLTATGGALALLGSSEHLSHAGRNYADYFATRNLAMAVALALLLALRARGPLVVLMLVTASIQLFDAVTASLTARAGLVPIDLAFVFAFVLAAARLSRWPRRPLIPAQR